MLSVVDIAGILQVWDTVTAVCVYPAGSEKAGETESAEKHSAIVQLGYNRQRDLVSVVTFDHNILLRDTADLSLHKQVRLSSILRPFPIFLGRHVFSLRVLPYCVCFLSTPVFFMSFCKLLFSILLLESLHDSRPMLGAGSSSRVELFQVFMSAGLWQDGAAIRHCLYDVVSIHIRIFII